MCNHKRGYRSPLKGDIAYVVKTTVICGVKYGICGKKYGLTKGVSR